MGNDTLTKVMEDLIINSWAENTRKQYRTYFGQWKEFCQDRNLIPKKKSQKAQNSYLRFKEKDKATQASTPQGECYP